MKKKFTRLILLFIIIVILLPLLTIKRNNVWVCQYTASQKWSTTWFYVWETQRVYEKSSLELWIENNSKPVQHKWLKLSERNNGIFWHSHRCQTDPPASIRFDLDKYIKLSSTEEIEELIRVFTEEENDAQFIYTKELELEMERQM